MIVQVIDMCTLHIVLWWFLFETNVHRISDMPIIVIGTQNVDGYMSLLGKNFKGPITYSIDTVDRNGNGKRGFGWKKNMLEFFVHYYHDSNNWHFIIFFDEPVFVLFPMQRSINQPPINGISDAISSSSLFSF